MITVQNLMQYSSAVIHPLKRLADGSAEIASPDIANLTMWHQIAKVDNARLDNVAPYSTRVDIVRPDNAASYSYIKSSRNTKKVQQLLSQFASTYAMVNFEKVSVAGFQLVYSDAAWDSRVLIPERCSLPGESAAAFCHSLSTHTESLQMRVDSSSSEDKDEASCPSVAEVYSVFLLNSG